MSDQIGLALDNARLYSETRHQLTELERARTAAVRAERISAIDGLAAGVAHEINNPLTIILGQIHVMLQGDPGEELQSQLGVIDGAARRAAKIVKDLRSFAEPAPAQRAPVSVGALVRQVLDANASRLRADHVEWRTALEEVKALIAQAPRGKNEALAIQEMQGDLAGVESSLPEIESAFSSERYLDAIAKAEAAKQTVEGVRTEITTAIEASKAGRRR